MSGGADTVDIPKENRGRIIIDTCKENIERINIQYISHSSSSSSDEGAVEVGVGLVIAVVVVASVKIVIVATMAVEAVVAVDQ